MYRTTFAALAVVIATTTASFARFCDDPNQLVVVTDKDANELFKQSKLAVSVAALSAERSQSLREIGEVFYRSKLKDIFAPVSETLHSMYTVDVQILRCSLIQKWDYAAFWKAVNTSYHVYVKKGRKLTPVARRMWSANNLKEPFSGNTYPAAHYLSEGLSRHEEYRIFHIGYDRQAQALIFRLNFTYNADEPIKQFSGVSLRKKEDSSQGEVPLYRVDASAPIGACNRPDQSICRGLCYCYHTCFSTYEDLNKGVADMTAPGKDTDANYLKNKAFCSSGKARWIFVSIHGLVKISDLRNLDYAVLFSEEGKSKRTYVPLDKNFKATAILPK